VKVAKYNLVLAVLLSSVSIAHADFGKRIPTQSELLSSPLHECNTSLSQAAGLPECESQQISEDYAVDVASDFLSSHEFLSTNPIDTCPPAQNDESEIREVPALPSSSSLFLSAMLSMGAWQCVRKSRNLHLSHLPEWYHLDGPYQIGHTVSFDPNLTFDALPVCLFDTPIGEQRPFIYRVQRELPSRCESQYFLPVTAPRGPPAFS